MPDKYMLAISQKTKVRFWSKVDKFGPSIIPGNCWVWTASILPSGYGNFWFNGECIVAHRMSWMICKGPLPKTFICHRCDNRKCVNPSHLFAGTPADNARDAAAKGKMHRNGHRKTKEEIVDQIRASLREGEKQAKIAKRYGVSLRTVGRISRALSKTC